MENPRGPGKTKYTFVLDEDQIGSARNGVGRVIPPHDPKTTVPDWIQAEYDPNFWTAAVAADAEASAKDAVPDFVNVELQYPSTQAKPKPTDTFWIPPEDTHEWDDGKGDTLSSSVDMNRDPKYYTHWENGYPDKAYRDMLKRKREGMDPTVEDTLRQKRSKMYWDRYAEHGTTDFNPLRDEGRVDETPDPFKRLMNNRVGIKRTYDDLLDEWDF